MMKLYAVAQNVEGHPQVDLVYAKDAEDALNVIDTEYEWDIIEVKKEFLKDD